MKRKGTLLQTCILCCMLCIPVVLQAQSVFQRPSADGKEILTVVNQSRNVWLQMFRPHELPDFGFSNEKEKLSAVPGNPIEVYLMSGTGAAYANGEFLIPLLVNGEARSFLTVAFFEGRYQVVSAGEMNLAKAAASYIRQAGNARLVWLRNDAHNADFIAAPAGSPDVVFTPLFTARRAGFDKPQPYSFVVKHFNRMSADLH